MDVEYTVPDAEPLADYWTSGEYIPSETIQYQQPSEKKDPTVQEDDEVERPMSIQEEELEAPTVPEKDQGFAMQEAAEKEVPVPVVVGLTVQEVENEVGLTGLQEQEEEEDVAENSDTMRDLLDRVSTTATRASSVAGSTFSESTLFSSRITSPEPPHIVKAGEEEHSFEESVCDFTAKEPEEDEDANTNRINQGPSVLPIEEKRGEDGQQETSGLTVDQSHDVSPPDEEPVEVVDDQEEVHTTLSDEESSEEEEEEQSSEEEEEEMDGPKGLEFSWTAVEQTSPLLTVQQIVELEFSQPPVEGSQAEGLNESVVSFEFAQPLDLSMEEENELEQLQKTTKQPDQDTFTGSAVVRIGPQQEAEEAGSVKSSSQQEDGPRGLELEFSQPPVEGSQVEELNESVISFEFAQPLDVSMEEENDLEQHQEAAEQPENKTFSGSEVVGVDLQHEVEKVVGVQPCSQPERKDLLCSSIDREVPLELRLTESPEKKDLSSEVTPEIESDQVDARDRSAAEGRTTSDERPAVEERTAAEDTFNAAGSFNATQDRTAAEDRSVIEIRLGAQKKGQAEEISQLREKDVGQKNEEDRDQERIQVLVEDKSLAVDEAQKDISSVDGKEQLLRGDKSLAELSKLESELTPAAGRSSRSLRLNTTPATPTSLRTRRGGAKQDPDKITAAATVIPSESIKISTTVMSEAAADDQLLMEREEAVIVPPVVTTPPTQSLSLVTPVQYNTRSGSARKSTSTPSRSASMRSKRGSQIKERESTPPPPSSITQLEKVPEGTDENEQTVIPPALGTPLRRSSRAQSSAPSTPAPAVTSLQERTTISQDSEPTGDQPIELANEPLVTPAKRGPNRRSDTPIVKSAFSSVRGGRQARARGGLQLSAAASPTISAQALVTARIDRSLAQLDTAGQSDKEHTVLITVPHLVAIDTPSSSPSRALRSRNSSAVDTVTAVVGRSLNSSSLDEAIAAANVLTPSRRRGRRSRSPAEAVTAEPAITPNVRKGRNSSKLIEAAAAVALSPGRRSRNSSAGAVEEKTETAGRLTPQVWRSPINTVRGTI